ncbi:MAG: hypothetical protein J7K81_06135 [Methanophagales archaeon]|nr:hypothetical protein [Methanophagales archaeon]
MNGKSLVEMQIPVEEVENIDELVSEGYYGCRSDAIRDRITYIHTAPFSFFK